MIFGEHQSILEGLSKLMDVWEVRLMTGSQKEIL